jgi:hypothetical protein
VSEGRIALGFPIIEGRERTSVDEMLASSAMKMMTRTSRKA